MALNVKLDELRSQLGNVQLSKQVRAAVAPEVGALQTKCDRMQRQLDEFKRQNQQLMEKINEGKTTRTGGGKVDVDDMKKRLELSVKINVIHEKEKEQLRLRLEELQREDIRIKSELAKVYIQLKAAKAAAGGQGGTGPKAA
jgi:predicted metal-dependent hydrolase